MVGQWPGNRGSQRCEAFERPEGQWIGWHTRRILEGGAQVAMLFKKGGPSLCDNYRPISFISVGCKLFANVLLERLRPAGAEERLWKTQFGFKRQRGTNDALFVVRRILEQIAAQRDGHAVLLALDWAKAFDSISSAALSQALARFGIPLPFAAMVEAITETASLL